MSSQKRQFIVHPEIVSIGLKGIFLTIENLKNEVENSEFDSYRLEVIGKAYNETNSDTKEDIYLNGFRQLHDAVGAPNRKNLSAPENLYKLLAKNKDIPRINLLVDIYNTVSIKYKLALGAHDWAYTEGGIHLRFTNGTEQYIPLGESAPKAVRAGEYSYIDDSNEIICYLDVRQVNKTKVTLNSKDVFFIVQGNANTPFTYIKQAANELIFLVKKYCGGHEYILGQIE
jgi:DNA/RNA-binding domain of Phe-tRNA-synthetase-like protein